jgi:2-polyprenyl-6-hydroxyphenyl methylase/3-demethylubiquinone-9 3-methyltransferase
MTPKASPAHCKICGAAANLFDVVDFAKHCSLNNPYAFGLTGIPVYYLQCQNCGFVYTEHCDRWSAEEFRRYIYNDEYHLVDGEYESVRPNMLANVFAELFASARKSRILDYGSGSGVFEGALRPRGFDVTSYDPFSHPNRPKGKFDLITCFEVMEHAPDPIRLLDDLMDLKTDDGAIVFSTGVQPADIETLRGRWWYIAPRNGHVSIFSEESLSVLAGKRGLNLYTCHGLLAFAKRPPHASAKRRLWYLCGAPGAQASPDWHGTEVTQNATRFRWTSSDRLELELTPAIPPQQCNVTVRVPYVNEIESGFAAQTKMAVGDVAQGVTLTTWRGTPTIQADFQTAGSLSTVSLLTPSTKRPCDIGNSADKRALGLAVVVKAE